MQIPSADVISAPYAYPVINVEWAGVLIGLCQKLQYRRAWEGTEAEQDAAIQQVEELIYQLMTDTPTGAAMPIGTTFPYFANLPANALECNYTLHNRVDYPDLYAALDASLIADADHFYTPPNPIWCVAPTKTLTASSTYATSNVNNLDDGSLGTTWLSNSAPPQWVEIAFSQLVYVSGYVLNPGNVSGVNRPTAWQFQWWDGSSWVALDTKSGISLTTNTDYTVNLASPKMASRFRLYMTAPSGVSMSLATFKLTYTEKRWKYGIVASEA